MDLVFWLEALVVFLCIAVGGRLGGVGLGAAGGFGVCILALIFGVTPGVSPIPVLLIIAAVIACVSILQGSGGLDLLVHWAERMLRRWPQAITITGPLVCSFFVMLVGTAYVAFAIYPVVAEVATSVKVRPERALSAAVISAGIGVMASPMSAAMAAMIGIMSAYDVAYWKILAVTVPTYFVAVLAAALSVYWRGAELEDDPEFKRRLETGEFMWLANPRAKTFRPKPYAKRALLIFFFGIFLAIALGSYPGAHPLLDATKSFNIPHLIQMVMLGTGFLIILCCRVPNYKFADGSIFRAGFIGLVGVFGIAWLTGTFMHEHEEIIQPALSALVTAHPYLFCLAAFALSSVVFSPTICTMIMIPLGLQCGLTPEFLVGTWACCYGDFIIPGGAQIGCTAFDRTGTTRLGSLVFNHSYLRPGLVFIVTAIIVGWGIAKVVF